MRRSLGTLLLLAALAGCGEDPQDPGLQPADPEPSEPGLVQMLVLTSAGGEVSPKAYFVDDRKQMKAYVKTFEDRDQVIESLQQAAGEDEGRLAVATVFVGCDSPSGVSVTQGADGWEVRPAKVPSPTIECFAPTTSIALVEIP
jgi:hypothetical protein